MAFFQRSAASSRSGSTKSRRPRGVSRRQRRRQLGFETLEDRRVMSADSPLAALQGAVSSDVQVQMQSFSSATAAGQQQILLNELYWQTLLNSGSQQVEATSFAIPTDPLSGNQWQYVNVAQEVGNPDFQAIFGVAGEDINVAPVFANTSLTGAGVVVAVIDEGIQVDHPDLANNVSDTLGLNLFTGGTGPGSTLPGSHGTAVAGLIGAVADNGLGGSGVAPGATLVPIQFFLPDGPSSGDPNALVNAFRYETDQIDITNNSWGPNVTRGVAGPTFDEFLALRDSITGVNAGRDGLGVIHVFASGNNAGTPFDFGFETIGGWDSTTYNGWVSSRYTIGVTGVDHDGFYNNIDGTVTGFAETGANVLVAAPTGSNAALNIINDTGLGSGIFTTDLTGEDGRNFSPDPITGQEFDRDFLEDIDYTSRFGGTSAAAPLVSGVVALMLEANPNLSWRDVQEILVRSARQNAEFEIPTAAGVQFPTQNTWIVNQMPVFSDPDVWNPLINPFVQTFTPTLDPTLTGNNLGPGPGPTANFVGGIIDLEGDVFLLNSAGNTGIHYQPTPKGLTNGAGYTVSQGRGVYGEGIGYAHGVVDAELAVQMAQQWGTKNQTLPDELTYTSFISLSGGNSINIPAMEVTGAGTGLQRIPGGLGGQAGFSAFWDEYFADDPFAGNPTFAPRGGYVELEVPANNTMTIETVEVKIALAPGTDTEFLDNMRVLLVSPSGTQQELNLFFEASNGSLAKQDELVQTTGRTATFQQTGSLVTTDTDPDNPLVVTYSSNRSWGERSDSQIIIDPTTGEPADVAGLLKQGWQLHFENYGNAAVGITGIEVAWHGSPIGANTQRVQGLIGVDDNRDDQFNFSRVIQNNTDFDGTLRLGEVTSTVDVTHESMGSNITVVARRASDGVVVDQFLVGADGNYYFDLVPDDYIISIEDPLGRVALEDLSTPGGLLQSYKTEWTINANFFKALNNDVSPDTSPQAGGLPFAFKLNVPLQADGTPVAFLDASGNEVVSGIKNLNFLLDPGPAVAPEVNFSGVVFADTNSDGIFNGSDVNVPGVSVFGDVNRNGQFDTGEVIIATNINGEYSLTIPLDSSLSSTVVNVGVITPVDWSFSDPSEGFRPYFVNLGDSISTNTDFAITPPVGESPGNGTSQDGYLLGVVFIDPSGDGVQQATEAGQAGIDVFIDSNGSGSFEAGERITSTNVNGAYVFEGVAPGTQVVRIETDGTPFIQTFPLADGPQVVNLNGGGTVSNILFGLFGESGSGGATATLDFGDLPAEYGITLLAEDGARHPEGVYYLGSTSEDVDAENTGLPSPDARGDNSDNLDDENGIVVDELVEGTLGHLVATASLFGGYLQGWVDFNGDFDFDDAGERIITNELLTPGPNDVFFDIPATLTTGDVFARFRYGEFGIDSVTGVALIGEVEDYKLDKAAPAVVVLHGPDFDEDGDVDGFDFLSWQRGFGKSGAAVIASDGDSNSDDVVNGADLADWSAEFGGGTVSASAPVTGDYDEDGDTDGSDFLTWQTGFGSVSASLALGDGNNNSSVDAEDLSIWSNNFGQTSSGAPLAATAGGPSESNSTPILATARVPLYANSSPNASAAQSSAQTTSLALSSVTYAVAAPAETTTSPGRVAGLAGDQSLNGVQQVALASLSSQLNLAEDHALTRIARHGVLPQIENRSHEFRLDRSVGVEELGRELQDRVLDRLFGRRQRPSNIELELSRNDEEVSEEALNVALGEETDWRFF